jgi:hypothetical protein
VATSKHERFTEDYEFMIVELLDIIATLQEACSILKRSKRAARLVTVKV